ncbi:MAG: hypothetical protein AAGI53_16475 [Planctomycetota bacterium]
MSEHAGKLLEMIESTVVAHGDEFGGWTKLDGDELKVFDGRITLRAQVHIHPKPDGAAMAQCSVLATLHDHGDEVLNGGVVGIAGSEDEALTSAAQTWLHLVAATIRSFIDGRAVTGCSHVSDAPGEGLDGFDGYVSPARWASFGTQPPECPDGAPWFRYTREALGPARLQMVKTVVGGNTPDSPTGWRRQLELNDEGLTVTDTDWPAPRLEAPGYWTRFALVAQTDEAQMAERDRLDRAIESFATKLSARAAHEEIEKQMSLEGYDLEFIDEIGSFATAGFTRAFFTSRGMNFNFAPTVIRARASGEIEAGVPLASRPAFSRGMALRRACSLPWTTMPPRRSGWSRAMRTRRCRRCKDLARTSIQRRSDSLPALSPSAARAKKPCSARWTCSAPRSEQRKGLESLGGSSGDPTRRLIAGTPAATRPGRPAAATADDLVAARRNSGLSAPPGMAGILNRWNSPPCVNCSRSRNPAT